MHEDENYYQFELIRPLSKTSRFKQKKTTEGRKVEMQSARNDQRISANEQNSHSNELIKIMN